MTDPGCYDVQDYARLSEIEAEVSRIRAQEEVRWTPRTAKAKANAALALIREDRLAGRSSPYWLRALAAPAEGHVFTRRTYRAARRRAISRMLEARDVWDIAIPDTPERRIRRVEYLIARHLARGIVARGRREKGMWT